MSLDAFLRKYGTETELDTLSQFDQFMINQDIKKQKEEEERLRLEEENRIKEAERKAAEVEAARLKVEELAFEEVKDTLRDKESGGDDAAEFVNRDGTKDTGRYQINERWVNQHPTVDGVKPHMLQADGTPDPVYNSIHSAMIDQFPQWDTIDDKGRRLFLQIPEINEQIANIIYDARGGGQFSSWPKVVDSMQTQLRNNSVDDMVNNSLTGNNPTLDDIASRINLDTTAVAETSGIAPIDVRSEDEKWEDRIAEAQREKTFFDAVSKYANDPVRLVPFLNTSSDVKEIIDITSIMGRVDKATQEGVEPNREDMLKLYEYQQANQAETSFGYKVGTVLGELPAFALEIGLTGGIYTGTKTATLKGAKYTLKRVLGKELRDKTAKYLAKHKMLDGTLKFGAKSAAAIAGATMQTTFNEGIKEVGAWATDDFLPGGRIRLGMKEHMMGTLPITMEESGELEAAVFTEGDDFNEAFAKSATDLWIEMVSERSGGAFPKLGSVARKWAVKQGILKKFLELNPTKKLKDFNKILHRVGWNGMLGEMAEERIGEVGRGIAYEVGIEDEGFKYKLPTMEQLSVEVVAFSIPGVGIALTQGAFGKTGQNNDPIPEFDLNDPAEVKKAIKAQGLTVEVVENEGAWDVNTYIGETLIDQSTGHEDKKNADAVAESMEKDLAHFANAKEVEVEGERPPIMEEEGITVEAKPIDQLELELKDKQDYNKMLVKDLKAELKNRNLSRAGKKADLVARLQEADKEAVVEEEAPAEDVGLTEEEKAEAKELIDEYVPEEEQEAPVEEVEEVPALTRYEQKLKKDRTTLEEAKAHHNKLYAEELKAGEITQEEVDSYAETYYNMGQERLKNFKKNPLKTLEKDLESWREYEKTEGKKFPDITGRLEAAIAELKQEAPAESENEKVIREWESGETDFGKKDAIENYMDAIEAVKGKPIAGKQAVLAHASKEEEAPAVEEVAEPVAEEAPAEAGLLPQLEQSLIRKYGKNYENNPAFQEYLDENDLVDIRELDEEGQKDLHSDLSVRDIDSGFDAGFLGVTPQNLKLLGDTIIGAGRFTFQTLPKFIQKQGKALGVTSDNFKQKWDEYSADPGKAPQKLKAYMKKVFTHMKKWYGKGKDAVVEYLKNPKIGAMIEVVEPAVEGMSDQEYTEHLDTNVAKVQRGASEAAMEDIQKNAGAPVYGWGAEHIGDLLHRMTNRGTSWSRGFGHVDEKVGKLLRELKADYGFERDYTEQLEAHAKRNNISIEQAKADFNKRADKYAEEHSKLPVYNRVQTLARDAAVAYGNRDFDTAINNLEELKKELDQGQDHWMSEASKRVVEAPTVEAKAERPLAPKPIDFKKAPLKNKNDIVYTYIFDKGISKAEFIRDYMSVAQSKESRKGLSRGQYKIELSKMYDKGKKEYKKGITKLVKNAQTKQGLKETFESGKHLMDWYDGFLPYMQKLFGKDAGLITDFIAITSAGARLNVNIGFGLKAYAQYKLGEDFSAGRRPNNMRKALRNAVKNHEDGTNLPIGGDKISNFSAALKGDPNAVVLDLWMARELGIKQTPAQKKAGTSVDFTDAQYRRYENIIKEVAFDMGVTPRQAQAAIWFGIREGHSPMHKGDPGSDSVTYEQILERTMPNFTYTDKNGKEHSLTDLNKDTIVYLNGSFGLTPEMLDTIGKALVDTGRYVYDNLSPAMQKMGNRLGVNAQNFKLKFAQFKNDAKGMTDNAKKWFKKVVGQMKTWFKKNAQSLIDSKPVQKAYDRLENMVTLKAVPEGIGALAEIRRSIEEAEAKVKAKGGKKRKPSETPFYKKVRAGRVQPKIDKQDNIASPWGQMFYLLSGRLKKVTGGMGILRALRGYEKHALTIEGDLKKAEPWLKFLHKLQPSKLKPWRNKDDWKQLEIALLKGNMEAILEIVDKHNAREAYDSMREMLDDIYYRAVNLTQEEKTEYDKLILDLAKARKEVPNKSWNVDKIKVWLTEKDIKYTSKDKKGDLLDKVAKIRGMKKKMSTLEENEARFSKLDKKIIYNFPYWGDDVSVYFPRDVVDPAAFNGYLTDKIGTGEMNKIEESLRDRYGIKKGDELPPGMLAQAIDAYLRTGGASLGGGKPGATKGRRVDKKTDEGITDDMVPYYSDPITSLMGYIHRMNESIARQKLFGKGVDIDNPNNSENVGAFVEGLITGENELGVKMDRKDQEEVKDIFQARFANSWGRFAGLVQTVKNATYISSLVDIFTTFIQTGDLFTGAIYRAGRNPIILTKAITKAFLGQIPLVNKFVRSPIDARDYGLIRISAEYTNNAEWLGKALGKFFKYSGFAAIDRVGKEALVNATIMRAQKEAKKGKLSPKTQNLIDDAFGKDSKKAKEVIKQLEAGEINDDIISLAYWTLLEHQPVAESEMTALYLRSSGAKLFYQLKTWQMKQLSLWRSETVGMWEKGQKAQAIKNSITMTIALVMAGAAPDVLRDFFQGRPIHLTDFAAENLFRLFGISKYSAEKLAVGKAEFFVGGTMPATRLASSVGKDMAYLNKWLKWAKDPIFESPPEETPKYGLSTTNLIPLVGKQLYTGLPFPRIPRSMEEIKKMMAGVPDSENGYIIEGWRGRKQILKRQVTYYNELADEKIKKGEVPTLLEMHLQMQATIELSNLEFQESLDNFWWQDKVRKIAKATGLQAP